MAFDFSKKSSKNVQADGGGNDIPFIPVRNRGRRICEGSEKLKVRKFILKPAASSKPKKVFQALQGYWSIKHHPLRSSINWVNSQFNFSDNREYKWCHHRLSIIRLDTPINLSCTRPLCSPSFRPWHKDWYVREANVKISELSNQLIWNWRYHQLSQTLCHNYIFEWFSVKL